MPKRKRGEFSSQEHDWEEIEWEEVPEESIQISISEEYRDIVRYIYMKNDQSAIRIFKYSKPRGGLITLMVEEYEDTLEEWIEDNSPIDGDSLHPDTFLKPLKTLIESVNFLRCYFGDFTFNVSDVIVTKSTEGYRCKLLPSVDRISSPLVQCMLSVIKVVTSWFRRNSIPIDRYHNVWYFLHCLTNLHTYGNMGFGHILTKHPLFCTQQERYLLFEMVTTVQTVLESYKGYVDVGATIAKALNVLGRNYEPRNSWYYTAYQRMMKANPPFIINPAILSCLQADEGYKQVWSFVRNIRNLAVHLNEHLDQSYEETMGECARDIERFVPGCFSAIFLMILEYRMEDHF